MYYVAPEVLGASQGKGYGPKCDVWGIGVVVFMMVAGQPPFEGDDMYKLIARGEYTWPQDVIVSDEAKLFVSRLLTVDPDLRLSAAQSLQEPWLTTTTHKDRPITLPSIDHLEKMRNLGRFKKEALLAIGYSLRRDQIRELSYTFRSLDHEGKGVISLGSLREAMLHSGMAEEVADSVFEHFSKISDGQVEYTSFVAACLEQRCYLEQTNLHEAFYRFQNANGYITAESLRAILGDKFSAEEAEDMVREADLTGDGQISFAEFSLMMGNRLPLARVAWRQIPLLENLNADEVAQIFEISQLRMFPEGVDLIREGEEADSFFMIEEGALELARNRNRELHRPSQIEGSVAGPGMAAHESPEERDTILLLDAPTVVGEMEMLTKEVRIASATATKKVSANEINELLSFRNRDDKLLLFLVDVVQRATTFSHWCSLFLSLRSRHTR